MSSLDIKNMVCDRCIMTVRGALEDLGYTVRNVTLGEADVVESPSDEDLEQINKKLQEYGFELLQEEHSALVEKIKTLLIGYRKHIEENEHTVRLSEYLTDHFHHNYSYLSTLFSKQVGITIEQYLIRLKIERVKELLSYGELTLSEIAWELNYSSVQYLSNQFKKITGETVSSFRKNLEENERRSLDSIS